MQNDIILEFQIVIDDNHDILKMFDQKNDHDLTF